MRVDAARRLPAGATLTAATPVTEAFGKSLAREKETQLALRPMLPRWARLSSGPFRRFREVAINLFSNDPFRGFVQVLIKRVFELQIFRPENFVDKRSGSAHDNGGVALPPVAIGFQTVAATQRGEQAPVPQIREGKAGFYRAIGLRGGRKSFLHPLGRSRRCAALPFGGGTFEQSGNLA